MNLKDDKDLLKLSRWKLKGVVTEPAMRTTLDSKRLALSKNETLPNTDLRKSERKKKEQEESEQSNDEPSASTRIGKRTSKATSKNRTQGRKGRARTIDSCDEERVTKSRAKRAKVDCLIVISGIKCLLLFQRQKRAQAVRWTSSRC